VGQAAAKTQPMYGKVAAMMLLVYGAGCNDLVQVSTLKTVESKYVVDLQSLMWQLLVACLLFVW
jgi:hypothetical protein